MWRNVFFIHIIFLILALNSVSCAKDSIVWRWRCDSGKCKKIRNDPSMTDPALSLEACKMFCNEYGLLWPRPTGETDLGNFLSKLNIDKINIHIEKSGNSDHLTEIAGERFQSMVRLVVPNQVKPAATGKSLDVYLVNNEPDITEFSLTMDESYTLKVQPAASNDKINATIRANSFFGIRHGLETLSQLIIYDDIRDHLLIVRDVNIIDKPSYPYRGILLDTSRNYYSIAAIKSTIDAMAAVKLNSFHWHITDSHSFPFVSERRPSLSKLGAYSPSQVYTKESIQSIVQFGLERGVRVIPEFDAPAHVGEGWQDTNLTVCFKAEPWAQYCVEPPCGQFNPTRDELYSYLEDIYKDMADNFKTDIFHMGGDEVSEECWKSSDEIQNFMLQNRWEVDKMGFLKLWDYFQKKAQEKAYKAFGKKLPLILWTSTLTDYVHVEKFLNKDDYIIQVWTTGVDPQIRGLLSKGFKLILSNYDSLYFDCGFGAWVGTGNNWCSPYIGWQKVYENSPARIAVEFKDQILGAEATLWSEQADSATLDGRLWPRAGAMAERLWSDPESLWLDAEQRMLHLRERLVRMGIQADALEPQWCFQNEGYCYN